ncbi:glycosyltransferase family 2 protein [Flavihumibacter profundi]|uniref:glycosyltransferase family 2 protein n=1 Tax=Flavihumibacter profundi TaxID=2716883 RepID=UPI001CC50385|nr:glycosyltransferase [Flavihumibacter profundi]MBZ5858026.1 glycosyltransferase [Flavihumibacter profundi]
MNERIPQKPPVIRKVEGAGMPLWSVMIPSYNCLKFLKDTIESVLIQDQGDSLMQIQVVDDASTDGDVEGLVKEIGKGRVKFYRQDFNVGSLRNFETCINRAIGKFIHLLHGDDMVKPGFYKEMETLFQKFPNIGAAFCKNSNMNENGNEISISASILEQPGIIPNWLEQISQVNLCQPPAVVVKRSVYENLGGFYAGHYGEDWEMWCRIAANYEVAYSPKCLAMYRIHAGNITTQSNISGNSVRDIVKFISIIAKYLPEEKQHMMKREAKRNYANYFSGFAYKNFNVDKKKYLNLAYKAFLLNPNRRTTSLLARVLLKFYS